MPFYRSIIALLLILMPATGWCLDISYRLQVRINPENREISGTGRIESPQPAALNLSAAGLQDIRINDRPVTPDGHHQVAVRLTAGKPLRIDFIAAFENGRPGFMDRAHVYLFGQWYPRPDRPVHYQLSVTLPEDFTVVSEADTITRLNHSGRITTRFQFDHPLDGLHLAASTRYVVQKIRHAGVDIETYFFKEDAALADAYIAYTRKYLDMYTALLTPYPYRRFAIVENVLPTGYAMPTFTLLGRAVVKLPFIVRTSLGHEILHQWFGNSVYTPASEGNWSEGLVSYLADHHYAELENRGQAYRKQILLNYQAYVNPDNAMPVNRFRSRQNRSQAAIGYGKASMLFHMLRRQFGDDQFYGALRALLDSHAFRQTTWQDIRHAFEKTTGENLKAFFDQWLERRDIPDLEIESTRLTVDQGRLALQVDIRQTEPPYRLRVPVRIQTVLGPQTHVALLSRGLEKVIIPLKAAPTRVVIDGGYDIMRTLKPGERPPILADIMGSDSLFVAAEPGRRAIYKPLVDALGVRRAAWIDPHEVDTARLAKVTILIAGFDNPLADRLLGGRRMPSDGVRLEVFKNPYAPEKRLLVMHAANSDESRAVVRKLSHYGKYTQLAFQSGHNTLKTTGPAASGLTALDQPLPRVLRPDRQETLADILAELGRHRVVFVGEQHDRFAHHLNQLNVIQALHASGADIGVGMEMFQAPFQAVIDAYLSGEIDERTFLARTEYFDRWRYDYHLYKPILDFLKANRIPLVALNVAADISRQTGRRGLDSLSPEQRRQIPQKLDFSNDAYRRDLHQVYNLHGSETGLDDFNYFYQAQTLWDEAMASRAAAWLAANPERKLVILAGNGHLRYKYGIPQRLYRRSSQPYTVILQDEEAATGIADYVLSTTPVEGIKAPKLGILAEEKDGALVVKSAFEHGPAGKAGLAGKDIITAVDGHPIKSLADLRIALFYTRIGDRIRIEVEREGTLIEKEVELKAHPKHIPMTRK